MSEEGFTTESTEIATPETDGKAVMLSACTDYQWVSADFSRKLERERDEARGLAEERKGYWENSVEEYEELRLSYQRIYRERDALQEQNAKLRELANRLARIVSADETQFHLADDIEPVLDELDQIKEGAK